MHSNEALNPLILDKSNQEGIESYICNICHKIPSPETALEEENCSHLFCETCMNNWIKNNNTCPFCKSAISTKLIKDKKTLIYYKLINLIIKCQEENCNWKGPYKNYNEHLENSHINFLFPKFFNNRPSIFELYKYYQASIHIHPLKYLDIKMDNGWYCDAKNLIGGCVSGLNEFNISKNFKRFRCMQCDYDLCEKCMIKFYDNKWIIKNINSNNRYLYLFKKTYYSTVHEHPLVFLDKSFENGWECDGRSLTGKCLSGITGFNQTHGIPRFRCEKCDFDLCENCMNFHKKKNFYELNKSYKVKCHNHPLIYIGVNYSNGWVCRGKDLEEKCLSGITNFHQTDGFERFRCDKCNFDLCINCMDFYLINE